MTTVHGGNPLFRRNGNNFKSSRKPREKISVVRQKYNADLTVRYFLDGPPPMVMHTFSWTSNKRGEGVQVIFSRTMDDYCGVFND